MPSPAHRVPPAVHARRGRLRRAVQTCWHEQSQASTTWPRLQGDMEGLVQEEGHLVHPTVHLGRDRAVVVQGEGLPGERHPPGLRLLHGVPHEPAVAKSCRGRAGRPGTEKPGTPQPDGSKEPPTICIGNTFQLPQYVWSKRRRGVQHHTLRIVLAAEGVETPCSMHRVEPSRARAGRGFAACTAQVGRARA